MNKTELVDAIAEKAGLTKKAAKAALDATLEVIVETLHKGDAVPLVGFGTFKVAERPARQGINPMTKQKIMVPARKVVKFAPGSELKEAVK